MKLKLILCLISTFTLNCYSSFANDDELNIAQIKGKYKGTPGSQYFGDYSWHYDYEKFIIGDTSITLKYYKDEAVVIDCESTNEGYLYQADTKTITTNLKCSDSRYLKVLNLRFSSGVSATSEFKVLVNKKFQTHWIEYDFKKLKSE